MPLRFHSKSWALPAPTPRNLGDLSGHLVEEMGYGCHLIFGPRPSGGFGPLNNLDPPVSAAEYGNQFRIRIRNSIKAWDFLSGLTPKPARIVMPQARWALAPGPARISMDGEALSSPK